MRKIITSLFAVFLVLGISAQNFGVALDYMMLSGTMVKDTDGNAVTYIPEGEKEAVDVIETSAVLNVSYRHSLAEKLDMAGSIGLGMGFGLVPMKLGMSYALGAIDVNAGMGLYMITDDSYVTYEGRIGDDEWKGSPNEFGINFGVVYNMNDVGMGLGYDMIKGDGNITLNAFTIIFSYAFAGNSKDVVN